MVFLATPLFSPPLPLLRPYLFKPFYRFARKPFPRLGRSFFILQRIHRQVLVTTSCSSYEQLRVELRRRILSNSSRFNTISLSFNPRGLIFNLQLYISPLSLPVSRYVLAGQCRKAPQRIAHSLANKDNACAVSPTGLHLQYFRNHAC